MRARTCVLIVAGAAAPALAQGPAGDPVVIYDNTYIGFSDYAWLAEVYAAPDDVNDIWVGDDFETEACYTGLVLSFEEDASDILDPFQLEEVVGRIYDALPNDPGAVLVAESIGWAFDGDQTWSVDFGDAKLPAGIFYFVVAGVDAFDDQAIQVYEQTQVHNNDGFQWNPGGALGFPDNLKALTIGDGGGSKTAPNAVITGVETECEGSCYADCNGDGSLNILDFVCYQGTFQAGDPGADCNGDGSLNILDFVCFQSEFQAGCP